MHGIPLSSDRAAFEAFEYRVETNALGRYLDSAVEPETNALGRYLDSAVEPNALGRYLDSAVEPEEDEFEEHMLAREAGHETERTE